MPKSFQKKAFFIFLTVLLILPSLFSCSGAIRTDSENELSLSSLEIIPTDTFSASDNIIYPESFTVLCESGTEGELFASSDDEEILEKSIFLRNTALSADYGITLGYTSAEDIVGKVTAEALSEDKGYDMLLISAGSASALIMNGALTDLDSVAGWSDKPTGYSHSVMKELSIGGKMFLATGDATPSLFTWTSAVLMNRELAASIEAESSLISAAKNGRFTYDMMLNYGKQISESMGDGTFYAPSVIRLKASDAIDLYISGGGVFFETDRVTDIPSGISFESKETDLYKNVMSLFGISEDDEAENEAVSSAPLFTVATMGELLALSKENSPFLPLPMPKSNIIQSQYVCNTDIKNVRFTALPYGMGENELAVMNLIYKISDGIISSLCENADKDGSGNARLIYESAHASLFSLFDFGDIEGFMESCVNERLSAKVFAMRAKERSHAASAALSIVIEKSTKAN